VLSLQFWNIFERFPVSVAFGLESRQAFLARALPGYRAAVYLKRVAKPQERIVGVDTEYLRFYVGARLETYPLSLVGSDVRTLANVPLEKLADELHKAGFAYLFTTAEAATRPRDWTSYLRPEFLASHAQLEFRDNAALVYRLH
jgi:hypothetical protein